METCTVQHQEGSTVADDLVINFCCSRVPRELHSDWDRNFESGITKGVLEPLGISKKQTAALHTPSDGMLKQCGKTAEEH
jgi:hypothetical protein